MITRPSHEKGLDFNVPTKYPRQSASEIKKTKRIITKNKFEDNIESFIETTINVAKNTGIFTTILFALFIIAIAIFVSLIAYFIFVIWIIIGIVGAFVAWYRNRKEPWLMQMYMPLAAFTIGPWYFAKIVIL